MGEPGSPTPPPAEGPGPHAGAWGNRVSPSPHPVGGSGRAKPSQHPSRSPGYGSVRSQRYTLQRSPIAAMHLPARRRAPGSAYHFRLRIVDYRSIQHEALMVFKHYIRYSPRRRALPRIAEGFSPTARGRIRVYMLHLHQRSRACFVSMTLR